MITTRVVIQLTTHQAHVKVDAGGVITVFKHNDSSCDMDTFTFDQQYEASDFISTPLPRYYYKVTIHGDSEE